jgi:hypothetical protein
VTGAKRLVLFHHDPGHSDSALEEMEAEAKAMWGDDATPPCLAAAEMKIDLSASVVAPAGS